LYSNFKEELNYEKPALEINYLTQTMQIIGKKRYDGMHATRVAYPILFIIIYNIYGIKKVGGPTTHEAHVRAEMRGD